MRKIKKILVVEDESAEIQALVFKFMSAGFDVIEAKNGEEGLWIALKERPDLIILDILMPRMDGMAMLHRLRKSKWGNDVPVVILSNLSDPEKVADALEKGVNYFLVKANSTLEDVLKAVNENIAIQPA